MLLKSDFANSLGPVVKEHCDQLELQLRRLRQLVAQKDVPKDNILPQVPRMLTRLESTPLLPSQQRKNELEQLNFSPIDEPQSIIQRSTRERQSLRTSSVKAKIVTNGTLNYCTPRLQRKIIDNSSSNSLALAASDMGIQTGVVMAMVATFSSNSSSSSNSNE